MVIIEKFDGGPVGLESLAVAMSEDARTLEEVYEPFLIKEGFIQRTSRGRKALEKTYNYLINLLYSAIILQRGPKRIPEQVVR